MKGIILAGGKGTRLYPVTKAISKQLIPIYDKPMIYYPLSVLMLANIREVLIITNPEFLDFYVNLLGDGTKLGMHIEYEIQAKPRGIADAFLIGEDFISNQSVCLVLGDNVFYGQGFIKNLRNAAQIIKGAQIFGYNVNNPSDFGIVEFNDDFEVISLEEKPTIPKSNYAIPGLYFYDNTVVSKAKLVKPSVRGEIEITEINKLYLLEKSLMVNILGRGFAWLDTGTFDGLSNASEFVRTIQNRTGLYVSCLEEISFLNKWIDLLQLKNLSLEYTNTEYGLYLSKILEQEKRIK